MSAFDSQEKQSDELLKYPAIYVIFKTTKAGATTCLTKVALEKGLKVILVVPKKRIAKEVISKLPELLKTPPRTIIVGANTELCPKLDPKIAVMFQFRKSCIDCEFKDPSKCTFQSLLHYDFDLITITYNKLQALDINEAHDALSISKKLVQFDVIILDEFSSAALSKIQTIQVLTKNSDGTINRLSDEIMPLLPSDEPWSIGLQSFLSEFENKKQSGLYDNNIAYVLTLGKSIVFKNGWEYIIELTKKGVETKKLQLAYLAMFSKKIVATCDDGEIRLTPSLEDALSYLKSLVAIFGQDKRVFIVDSYQPSTNFDSLFGNTIKVAWGENGDPLHTNAAELIIADSAHWGSKDFLSRPNSKLMQEKIKISIEKIVSLFSAQAVLIVCTNKAMAKVVFNWKLPKEVRITWFRSEWMRGVPTENRRVMILLGGPYLPKNAYVSQSKSFKVEDFIAQIEGLSNEEKAVMLPSLLRLDDMRGEFINSVGRPKDAEGKQRSVVIAFGMQQGEINGLLRDNSPFPLSKPNVGTTLFGGAMANESTIMAELWMNDNLNDVKAIQILSRIIYLCKKKKSLPLSQVVLGATVKVKAVAIEYQSILEKYGVNVVFKTGGVCFEFRTP